MNNLPLITLIIPVYNVEHYLKQCLDSVIRQTYPKIEIIIVDDGSSDKSGKICEEYAEKDCRIRVHHTKNDGLSAARNYGLDHINKATKYIAFLDSDDWMEPNAIQSFYDAAIRSEADIVVCGHYNEFPKKSVCVGINESIMLSNKEQIIDSFICKNSILDVAWNKLYKSKLFEEIRYPENRIYEDIATTYRLINVVENIYIIPEPLIHYRMRNSSISGSHSIRNLTDYWLSCIEKYRAMSAISESIYKELLGSCILSIGRMWRWIYRSSENEKLYASKYLDEMQMFIANHYDEVMGSNSFSLHHKFICLATRFRSPIVFRLLYLINQVYGFFHRTKMYY